MIIVLICSKNMTIIFSKSARDFLLVQIISHCIGKKHLTLYGNVRLFVAILGSKSGRKLVLGATIVYSHDLSLRTNYYSIVSFCLYAWEIHHSRHGIGKVWETWDYKFASIRHFNFDIAMLHIDETPVKVGM